jgi:ADP-heptose:LPS heptosyltransferase
LQSTEYNKNANKIKDNLNIEAINRLGLTREEFQDFSIKDLTKLSPEEHIEVMPQMVVAKIKYDATLLNLEDVDRLPVKKGEYYLMRMFSFIQLYNKDRVLPTPFFKKYYNTYRGEDLNNKSLFVYVYKAGIGDLLFQQAILRILKIKYPRVFITFAVPTKHIEYIKSWNTADRVVSNITEVKHFINADYHLNFEFIVKTTQGYEENVYRNFAKRASLSDPLDTLSSLFPQVPANPEYRRQWIELFNKKKIQKDNFIIVNFNSNNPMRIPRPKFRKQFLNHLIKNFPAKDIIFIDTKDKLIQEDINKLIKPYNNIYNLSKYSDNLISSTALISLSKLVISVDTGIIHMAASVGIKTYGIYGPFPAKIRINTYPNCDWIEANHLECVPCCEHDLISCENNKGGYPICYDELDQDVMITKIKKLLNKDNQ